MKRKRGLVLCFSFILLLFVFSSVLALCSTTSSVPLPDTPPDTALDPPPSIDPEPLPEHEGELPLADLEPATRIVDYSADLLEISQRLSYISTSLELLIYVFLPFGFAFFICWQLGKFFFRTFFR